MAKVIVTGAAGFMGAWLVDWLIDEGHEVYGIDDMSGGYERNINPKSGFYKLDLRDRAATQRFVEDIRPEVLYHLAADATEGRSQFTPINCTERGVLAHVNILVPCIKAGIRRVVVTSSMSVYGSQATPFDESLPLRPDDVYGINKASIEEITKILGDVYKFEYVILRPHNVYGERQNIADPYRNVLGIWMNSLLRGKALYVYGDGEQKRAFSYIRDATPCIGKAGFLKECCNEVINIGGKEAVTLNEAVKLIIEEFGGSAEVIYLPPRPREVKLAYSTYEKSERLLGYKEEFSLREGISNMVEWVKKLGPQEPSYMESLELTNPQTPKTWLEKLI